MAVEPNDATHKTLATPDDDTEGQSLNHKTLAVPDEDEPGDSGGATRYK